MEEKDNNQRSRFTILDNSDLESNDSGFFSEEDEEFYNDEFGAESENEPPMRGRFELLPGAKDEIAAIAAAENEFAAESKNEKIDRFDSLASDTSCEVEVIKLVGEKMHKLSKEVRELQEIISSCGEKTSRKNSSKKPLNLTLRL